MFSEARRLQPPSACSECRGDTDGFCGLVLPLKPLYVQYVTPPASTSSSLALPTCSLSLRGTGDGLMCRDVSAHVSVCRRRVRRTHGLTFSKQRRRNTESICTCRSSFLISSDFVTSNRRKMNHSICRVKKSVFLSFHVAALSLWKRRTSTTAQCPHEPRPHPHMLHLL